MSAIYIADVHIGNHRADGGVVRAGINDRCREHLEALRRARSNAGDRTLVVLGDLFDSARPEPQVIRAVQDILRGPAPTIVLVGNHDQVSDAPGDHALGPLQSAHVDVVDEPRVYPDLELALVPYKRCSSVEDYLRGALDELAAEHPLRGLTLGLHAGIAHDATPGYLRGSGIDREALLALLKWHELSLAVAGDWHDPYVDPTRIICQVGALVPTGWQNPGIDYGWVVHGSETLGLSVRGVVPGPRFFRVDRSRSKVLEHVRQAAVDESATRIAIRYYVDPAVYDAEVAWVDETIDLDIVTVDVRVDQAAARDGLRQAAGAARRSAGLHEAAAAYATKAAETAGVDPVAVTTEVLGCLSAGDS